MVVNKSLSVLLLSLAFLLPTSAQATDFSDSPFSSQLLRSRAQTSILRPVANSTRLLGNYQIGTPTSGVAVDDTTSNTNVFATPFALGAVAPLASPYLYRGGLGWGARPLWGGFGVNPAMLGLASGAPGIGYTPFSGGYWGVPGMGVGLGGWGRGLGWGGYRGLGWGGYPGLGWGGYRGYGWGGLYNPAGAALTMGAFGNFADNDELGEMGYTGPVNEGPPSKASGNYYAPSTPDPTAAGNYYSTSSPAVNMPIKPYTSPKSYWGSSGSPLPKDINKVPW